MVRGSLLSKNVASQPTRFSCGLSLFTRLTPCILSQRVVVVFYGNAEKPGKWPSVKRLSLPCFFLAKVAPREGESMEQQAEEVTAEQPSEEPQAKAEVRPPHQGPQRDEGGTEGCH